MDQSNQNARYDNFASKVGLSDIIKNLDSIKKQQVEQEKHLAYL